MPLDDNPPLPALPRLGSHPDFWCRAGLDRPEVLPDPAQHRTRFEIPGDRQHRIARRVVAPVVLVQIVARDRFEIRHVANNFMVVGMNSKRGRLDFFCQAEGRVVLMALAFGDDHCPLRLSFPGLELAVHHTVGFELERQIDAVRRHRFEVGRPVDPGERVPIAAVPGNGAIQHPGGKRRRAFELHMLNPMGDPGDPGSFVAGADTVPDPAADERRRVDFFESDLQAVAQASLDDARVRACHHAPFPCSPVPSPIPRPIPM